MTGQYHIMSAARVRGSFWGIDRVWHKLQHNLYPHKTLLIVEVQRWQDTTTISICRKKNLGFVTISVKNMNQNTRSCVKSTSPAGQQF